MDKKEVSMAAIFTAFVAVSTMSFTLYIPATRGYFNLGEAFVYISAMLGGPVVGALAGGLGSAFADIALGYSIYAPGTLVIKGLEGFIVGYIFRKYIGRTAEKTWRIIGISLALLISFLLVYVGLNFFTGEAEATISIPGINLSIPIYFTIYHMIWLILSLAVFILLSFIVLRVDPSISASVLGTTLGGLMMISGYFLYEAFALRLGLAVATVEVPFNTAQFLIGTLISISVVQAVRKVLGVKT